MSSRVLHTLRRSVLIACAVVTVAGAAQAQPPQLPPASSVPSGPLTLEQVLSLAEARSESVGIAQIGVTRTEGDAVRARASERPQLSAAASYDRSLANEFQGVFDNIDFGNGSSDSSSGDGGGFEDLPFGRANTWRATLSFSQNLYSGGRIGAQKLLAGLGRTSAEQALVGARAQLRFDVTQAYYDALLSERLVVIAQATLDQAGATLKQTQAGFDAGTQPEFEVLRATVSRDSQTPLLIRQRATRDVAMLRLKQLLELPADYDLRLADDLGDPRLAPAAIFAERVAPVESALRTATSVAVSLPGAPMPERNAVAEAGTTVSLREAALKAVEAERLPSVSFTSNYSRIAYPTGALPVFDRANWSLGVSMSVPILTGGRQKGDEMVARADVEQARLQQKQVQELAALDTRSAWAELVAARSAWEATAGTVQQATRAYEIADVRYRAGVSTQLELSDSRLLLQQAEANRALAARDFQVARARVALLPELPLGAGGTTGGAARPATGQGTQPAAPQQQQQQGRGQLTNAAAQQGQSQTGTR
ncbi:MAG TPA: TolC family protein [Vicinamibacterales bacterium]|jgi:outer membrane protein TolC|nr:TolC family protein [Vicinamibacterales bacterium]